MKRDTKIIGVICILLVLGAFILLNYRRAQINGQGELAFSKENALSSEEISSSTKEDKQELSSDSEMAVYVSGAVKHPGLFRFYGKARVSDAIEAVGGFCNNASTAGINLARVLLDGEEIHVITKKEERLAQKKTKPMDKENVNDHSEDTKLDINQAKKEELMQLPGIGEAKALAIITYREEHGSFRSTEELMQITGIKEGVYNKIKEFIKTS